MQTVSKTYGAADAEAQAPAAPERKALGRAKVASICLAAALSGAAVASVARVRTRTYVADLYADLGGTFTGPDQINMKLCGDLGKVCPGTTRCYEKRKNDGETKYECAEEAPGSSWEFAAGASRTSSGTSKKKPGTDSLSGGGGDKPDEIPPCYLVFDPVCDTEGNWHSNDCVATKQKKKKISSEHVFDNGKCVKR